VSCSGLPPKSDIEVEYAYAANGRISVVARVPSVRHSAQVEIRRSQPFSTDDLKTWRARLRNARGRQRSAAAGHRDKHSGSDGSRERAKTMDMLLMKVGRAACDVGPEQLAASQSTALSSAAEVAEARRVLKAAQQSADATLTTQLRCDAVPALRRPRRRSNRLGFALTSHVSSWTRVCRTGVRASAQRGGSARAGPTSAAAGSARLTTSPGSSSQTAEPRVDEQSVLTLRTACLARAVQTVLLALFHARVAGQRARVARTAGSWPCRN